MRSLRRLLKCANLGRFAPYGFRMPILNISSLGAGPGLKGGPFVGSFTASALKSHLQKHGVLPLRARPGDRGDSGAAR